MSVFNMESKMMTWFKGLVLVSMCLPAAIGVESGVSYSYSPPPAYYSPPPYYDTVDTYVDYREANNTRHCGVQPTVHRHGLAKDRTTFGEYPWVVAVLDTYNVYRSSGVLISPRHVLTAANGISGYNANDLVVRVGDYDLQSDHNYLEVYKNYEIPVCKKHFYYSVPQYGYDQSSQYGYSGKKESYYQNDYNYDVVILELSEDVDFDQYPQVEPICLPDFYYRSKDYYKEYYTGYGRTVAGAGNAKQKVNEEGVAEDLECWVVGYSYSPQEELKYQTEKTTYASQTYQVPAPSYNPPSYGYGSPPYYSPPTYQTYTKYVPAYSYETYSEYSLTPRRAKVHKVYEEYYQQQYYAPPPSYGYGYSAPPPPAYYPTKDYYENWEADYYYDTCRADVGSAVMCRIPGKYGEEDYGKSYNTYVPYYSPPPYYAPPPYYSPPSYSPPTYYSPPPYYSPPTYNPPSYQKYKRAADYYSPPPYYSPPTYYSPPPYYSPPTSYSPPPYYSPPTYYSPPPYYSPPTYEAPYKIPIDYAENFNEEYRRFAVFGIVQYPTQCSYGSYESKKLKVAPIKDLLPWILNVLHTQLAQCYQPPAYYSPPTYDYTPPTYEPPTYYAPPTYEPSYSPPPYYAPPTYEPSYSPPPYYAPPTYEPSYSPPPYYSPPTYEPSYSPPPYYSPPTYEPSYSPPPYYSPPTYEPSYSPPPYYAPPTYEPSYSPPPYYSPPTYEPSYSPPPYYSPPTYEPSYSPPPYYAPPTYEPSYSPPPYYSPPTYDTPSYSPPPYYQPPSYAPPTYY